jgi:hypothetical protein
MGKGRQQRRRGAMLGNGNAMTRSIEDGLVAITGASSGRPSKDCCRDIPQGRRGAVAPAVRSPDPFPGPEVLPPQPFQASAINFSAKPPRRDSCFTRELANSLPFLPSTLAITSPGREQYWWRLSRPVEPEEGEDLNRRLAYAMAADLSGWDLTQRDLVLHRSEARFPPRRRHLGG